MIVKKLPPVELFALIQTEQQCKEAVNLIKKHSILSIDFEWSTVPLSYFKPKYLPDNFSGSDVEMLSLVQIATPDNACFIFDVTEESDEDHKRVFSMCFFDAGLKDILESKQYLKIFHDCRSDAKVLFQASGIEINNIYDTQISYAVYTYSTIKKYPFPVSLKTLISKLFPIFDHEDKDKFHEIFKNDHEYWLKRPFSIDSLRYAAEDVIALFYIKKELDQYIKDKKTEVEYKSQLYAKLFKKNDAKFSKEGYPIYGFCDWDSKMNLIK